MQDKLINTPSNEDDKVETRAYGKFNSGEELLAAYNSLEKEFTRRSQRIKELEKEISTQKVDDKWQEKVFALHNKYPISKELGSEIAEVLSSKKELIKDENCLEKALLIVLADGKYSTPKDTQQETQISEESKRKIIGEYLDALTFNTPEVALAGGEIPVILPRTPSTVKEAGALAKTIFNSNR